MDSSPLLLALWTENRVERQTRETFGGNNSKNEPAYKILLSIEFINITSNKSSVKHQ